MRNKSNRSKMFKSNIKKQYGLCEPMRLFNVSKDNLSMVQRLSLWKKHDIHTGCVNTICWNERGTKLLSGSDDQYLIISDPYSGHTYSKVKTAHRANIFSARYLPGSDDTQVVSCSGDGKVYHTDMNSMEGSSANCFDCHFGTVYEVLTIPTEPSTFLTCGEDGTIRWFDLRLKSHCTKEVCKEDILVNCRRAVTSLSINPIMPYQLGVACADGTVKIYDRRLLGTRVMGNYNAKSSAGMLNRFSAEFSGDNKYRITSLQYSADGDDLLVSYSTEHLYLFSTKDGAKKKLSAMAVNSACEESNGAKNNEATTQPPNTEPEAGPSSTQQSAASNQWQPPMKRLRLRGDWSDTGPDARPEGEARDVAPSTQESLMRRMSDMLTQWLDGNRRRLTADILHPAVGEQQRDDPGTSGVSTASHSLGMEGGSESTETPREVTENSASREESSVHMDVAAQDAENSAKNIETAMETGDCLDTTADGTKFRDENLNEGKMDDESIVENTMRLDVDSSTLERNNEKENSNLRKFDQQTVDSKRDTNSTDTAESSLFCNDVRREPPSNDRESRAIESNICNLPESPICDGASVLKQGFTNTCEAENSAKVRRDSNTYRKTLRNESQTLRSETKQKKSGRDLGLDRNLTVDPHLEIYPSASSGFSTQVEPVINLEYNTVGTTASTIQLGFVSFADDNAQTSEHREFPSSHCQRKRRSCDNLVEKYPAPTENIDILSVDKDVPGGEMSMEISADVCSSDVVGRKTVSMKCKKYLSHPEVDQLFEGDISGINENVGTKKVSAVNVVSNERLRESLDTIGEACQTNSDSSRISVQTANVQMENENVILGYEDKGIELRQSTFPSTEDAHDIIVVSDDKVDREGSGDIKISNVQKSESPVIIQSLNADVDFHNGKNPEYPADVVTSNISDRSTEPPTSSGKLPTIFMTDESGKNLDADAQSREDNTPVLPSTSFGKSPENVSSDNNRETVVPDSQTTENTRRSPNSDSEEEVVPAAPRQRRIGRSGPPTGNFQLTGYAADNDDSSDENAEVEGIEGVYRTLRRNRSPRLSPGDLERNIAAIKLQELHKKLMERRECEEMRGTPQPVVKQKYCGHRNARTMIKEANFWGNDYVMSGSDCGHIFVWNRHTARLVALLEADKHVVNCLQPHPFDPVLASSGIDYDIKLWAPVSDESCFNEYLAKEVTERNEVMLTETRDTVTVPAAIMLRVLATLNHFRSGSTERASTAEGINSDSSNEES